MFVFGYLFANTVIHPAFAKYQSLQVLRESAPEKEIWRREWQLQVRHCMQDAS